MKRLLFLLLFISSQYVFCQINIRVVDQFGSSLDRVEISYNGQIFFTDQEGNAKIPISDSQNVLSIQKKGFQPFEKIISPDPKVQNLTVLLVEYIKTTQIPEVIFQRNKTIKTTDVTSIEISEKQAREIVSVAGGIEGLLKTLPSVNSNTELSSQYMVRGGNYDENLIYINDVEIYRPFLIRNSLQEGMSIINPDMVSNISFSAGGFEARYGDKMSSALNIYYRKPEKLEFSQDLSLIGSRTTIGYASKDKKFTGLISARYRDTEWMLDSEGEDTDFKPKYFDVQSYFTYSFSEKWSASFLGYLSKNTYEMIPHKKEVEFGSLQNPIHISIFYNGKEDDSYKNMMGTASLFFKPNKKWLFSWDNFAYQNREKEYYTISSAYLLSAFDPTTGKPTTSYDVVGQIDHARNDLLTRVFGSQLKAKFSPDLNTDYEIGFKVEKEKIEDVTNEWQLLDYTGDSVPKPDLGLGVLDPTDLTLNYQMQGDNKVNPLRLSAYAQYSKKFYWGENKVFVNAGVRGQHWDFNKETIISPRLQFAFKPNWDADFLFRLSGGVYYQAPFYKEMKNLSGEFNKDIEAQKSIQVVAGADYEFSLKDRPFKLTAEAYYKKLDNLIPFFVENVRTRYTGANNADGYAYGVEARLFGEFVPGVDSWISASYGRAFENIEGRGVVSRPTDPRFRFAMFFQDYMPTFPTMKVNITVVYSSGLPTGAPVLFDPITNLPDYTSAYRFQKRLPDYKRVDIGLTKVFIDQKNKAESKFWSNFKELALGVQIFNAFNIKNTVSNHWVTDVASGYSYPVPVRLIDRFFNVKLEVKL